MRLNWFRKKSSVEKLLKKYDIASLIEVLKEHTQLEEFCT